MRKQDFMSIAEMKKELIEKINKIEDESLLKKISNVLDTPKPRPSIDQIFEEAKAQYGNTLKRLAE